MSGSTVTMRLIVSETEQYVFAGTAVWVRKRRRTLSELLDGATVVWEVAVLDADRVIIQSAQVDGADLAAYLSTHIADNLLVSVRDCEHLLAGFVSDLRLYLPDISPPAPVESTD